MTPMTSACGSLILAVAFGATGGWFDRPARHTHQHQGGCQLHQGHLQWPVPSAYPPQEGVLQRPGCSACQPGGRVVTPGPGHGHGFPNGNPDGYGWVDYGSGLPLGADRTPDYFFRRYYASLPEQMFFPTYYNPYVQRGQRYVPFVGGGGWHPFGGRPMGSSATVFRPEPDDPASAENSLSPAPVFSGRTELPEGARTGEPGTAGDASPAEQP
jgi:hypothetical protein